MENNPNEIKLALINAIVDKYYSDCNELADDAFSTISDILDDPDIVTNIDSYNMEIEEIDPTEDTSPPWEVAE